MTLPASPRIDCHIHAIDPVRFPYSGDTPYRPSGQEIAPAAQLIRVFDAFDVRHALVVATNSDYGSDSRILLDTLKQGGGRFRGVAVVENDVDIKESSSCSTWIPMRTPGRSSPRWSKPSRSIAASGDRTIRSCVHLNGSTMDRCSRC